MEHQCHESPEFSSLKKWRCSFRSKAGPGEAFTKLLWVGGVPLGISLPFRLCVLHLSVREPNYRERGKQTPGSPGAKPGNRPLGLIRL